MKTIKTQLIGLLFASVIATSAYAVPLIPDTAVVLPGTTALAQPELAGTIIEDNLVPFSITGSGISISGQIQERVVRETVSGTLDFYWRLLVDNTTSRLGVGSFRLGSFFPSAYDANWRSDGVGTVNPDFAFLFSGGGGFVNFGFTSGLAPGVESRFMFLHTDATAYDKSALMDVAVPGFNPISDTFATFAPAAVVAEPGSALLLLLAMGSLAAFRRTAQALTPA